jgi:4-(2-carboxyphenyl)-2-oxobut-3-enoate aldolase
MARLPELKAVDLHGVIAYMVTPVKERASRMGDDAVDLDETARAVNALIRDGVTGICLNGTFGEVASLTWQELQAFTAAVVSTADGRVPVFAGSTTLNTRDSIMRTREFQKLGADGVMLGRPMLAELSDPDIVGFYRDVAEAAPEMAIFLYDDSEAFKRPLSTGVYAELAKIPQIIGCKYRSRLLIGNIVSSGTYNADRRAVGDNIRLLTHEWDWPIVRRWFDEQACWSSSVNAGPSPMMAMRDALHEERWDDADAILDDLTWSIEGLIPSAGFATWHVDKIPFMKNRFAAAGYIKCGPPLPPYNYISPERLAVATECGRRARELQVKYSTAATASAT